MAAGDVLERLLLNVPPEYIIPLTLPLVEQYAVAVDAGCRCAAADALTHIIQGCAGFIVEHECVRACVRACG